MYVLRFPDEKSGMTWGWNATPLDAVLPPPATKTKGAWPSYENKYLRQKIWEANTAGLDGAEKAVYLDQVTKHYEREADQALRHEFETWLEGRHETNFNSYVHGNEDGGPIRRWVFREKDSEDVNGGYKVAKPREGWVPTWWGRSQLTHLPGVKEYLQGRRLKGARSDLDMQMLAEFGPQNLDQAWLYFKHWVKKRPYSDTAELPALPMSENPDTKSHFGMMPHRMQRADPNFPDMQPGVLATETSADAPLTSAEELDNAVELKDLYDRMQAYVETPHEQEQEARDASREDALELQKQVDAEDAAHAQQVNRHNWLTGPVSRLF